MRMNRMDFVTMHLMDADAREEEARCGAEASLHDLASVQDHLERLAENLKLSTVGAECKVAAVPWLRDWRLALEGASFSARVGCTGSVDASCSTSSGRAACSLAMARPDWDGLS